MNRYTFRNRETGEIRAGVSNSRNNAARSLEIDVPDRGKLPEPWQANGLPYARRRAVVA